MTHAPYVSKTNWDKFFKTSPTNYATFKDIKICPCLLKTGHIFRWTRKGSLFDQDILAHNCPILEGLMWMMYDLMLLLNNIALGKEKHAYQECMLMSEKVLKAIKDINDTSFPSRDLSLPELGINLTKKWKELQPGEFRLEWYLLPNKNQSLALYTQSEIVSYQMRLLAKDVTIKDKPPRDRLIFYLHYLIQAAKLMNQALEHAENCDSDYKTQTLTYSICKDIDVYTWLYKIYNGYLVPGTTPPPHIDRAICLTLLKHVRTMYEAASPAVIKILSNSYDQGYSKVDKLTELFAKDFSDQYFYTAATDTPAQILADFLVHNPSPF